MTYHPRTHPKAVRAASSVIGAFGTVASTVCILSVSVSWMAWNTFGPASYRFDPAPSFVVLLLFMNVVSIVMQPLMLVSNNLQQAANDENFAELKRRIDALSDSIPKG